MNRYDSKPHKFFRPGHPDLERAWQALPGGPSAYHAPSGEVWQYMGTWYVKGRWEHQFRRRWHPQPASANTAASRQGNGPATI